MWKVFSVCFNNSRKQDMAPPNGCRREINCGCGGMCTAPCEKWLNQMCNLISPWTGLLHAKSKKSIEYYVGSSLSSWSVAASHCVTWCG